MQHVSERAVGFAVVPLGEGEWSHRVAEAEAQSVRLCTHCVFRITRERCTGIGYLVGLRARSVFGHALYIICITRQGQQRDRQQDEAATEASDSHGRLYIVFLQSRFTARF